MHQSGLQLTHHKRTCSPSLQSYSYLGHFSFYHKNVSSYLVACEDLCLLINFLYFFFRASLKSGNYSLQLVTLRGFAMLIFTDIPLAVIYCLHVIAVTDLSQGGGSTEDSKGCTSQIYCQLARIYPPGPLWGISCSRICINCVMCNHHHLRRRTKIIIYDTAMMVTLLRAMSSKRTSRSPNHFVKFFLSFFEKAHEEI